MKLRLAAAFALVSTMLFAGTASAQPAADEGSRPMGIRLETSLAFQDFNFVGVGPSGDLEGIEIQSAPGLSPHGDIRIGYDLDMGLTPVLGLGYRSQSLSSKIGGGEETTASASTFVLALELRYYLSKHRRGLQPFVWGELNTSFVSFDIEGASDEELDALSDANDHTELNVGIGAEYKFTRSFAAGGKWGLGFGFKPIDQEGVEISNTTIGTSSSVYLAWRL